jgi:adenylate kinase
MSMENKDVIRVILLGPPGAGKGTQAVFVSQSLGVPHIASGDLFREAQGKGTKLGLLVKSYMEKGELIPDEITVSMVLERSTAPDCKMGYILDGFPRTIGQAKALDKALKEKGDTIDKVVYIKVSDDELLRRLGGRWICRDCQAPYHMMESPPKVSGICDRCGGELYQRADDNEETVKNRLSVYSRQTVPLIDYYSDEGKLVEVDGAQGIDDVAKAILMAVNPSEQG